MKKILNILMAALVLTGISCSEDLEYKPGGVTPVQTLLLPADNYYVELQSASTATLRFSWEPALAADGQLPHYEVVFFGKPAALAMRLISLWTISTLVDEPASQR